MGLFGNLFGTKESTKENEKKLPWIVLEHLDQLEDIQKKSSTRPQIIFKHSTTCGISRMALGMFTRGFDLEEGSADLYFLDLHAHRTISNEVAIKFQVLHQSPQLLVIKNGQTIFHASHGSISEVDVKQFI